MFSNDFQDPHQTFWHRKLGPTLGAVVLFIVEVFQIVIVSAAIVVPIRYFLIQPFNVKGASMEPNFYNDEYLIIDEISYRMREPVRGEIVVFRYPNDPSQFFIKRVIGLPGETVEVTDGKIVVYNETHPNGIVLQEPYLFGEMTEGKKKAVLVQDEYWLMGDNRDESLDSRSFGQVKRTHLIGRVWVRGLPFSRIGTFEIPNYHL